MCLRGSLDQLTPDRALMFCKDIKERKPLVAMFLQGETNSLATADEPTRNDVFTVLRFVSVHRTTWAQQGLEKKWERTNEKLQNMNWQQTFKLYSGRNSTQPTDLRQKQVKKMKLQSLIRGRSS